MFAPHFRITALGKLGTGDSDRFSYGLNVMAQAGGDARNAFWDQLLDPNDDVFDDWVAAVSAFHGRAASYISQDAVLDTVKIALIGADGKYEQDPYVAAVNVPGAAPTRIGGNPNTNILPQTALAVSLTTERRGPTGKGRFYLPMPGFGVNPDNGFKMPTADAELVRGSAVTLINAINNQPGIDVLDLEVCVASTKGYNTPVTGVRVGRVIDTIRTRRNALAEAYTAVAAVA